MLGSCTPEVDEFGDQAEDENVNNVENDNVEEVIKTYSADLAKFHFVVDWLSETKIVFVEKSDSMYYLKTFDISSGEIEILYEESKIIVDVLIHPLKNTYLLHTTDDPSSATLKIISFEGVVLDEVTIASSELSIEWSDTDPSLILLTAFHQDWTYDVFLYSGEEKEISLMPLEDPFPKWLGTEKIVTVDVLEHSLDGGELIFYDRVTRQQKRSGIMNVVYFDANIDSLLVVQINGEDAEYKITDQEGMVLSDWTMPAVSNYSEWVIPEISWIAPTTVIMPSTSEGGQLDDLREPFKLVRVEDGNQEVLMEYIPTGKLRCSPDGEKCLTGNAAETIIDTIKKEEATWLLLH